MAKGCCKECMYILYTLYFVNDYAYSDVHINNQFRSLPNSCVDQAG